MSNKELLKIWNIWLWLILAAAFSVYALGHVGVDQEHHKIVENLKQEMEEVTQQNKIIHDFVVDLKEEGIDVYIINQ